MRIAANVLLFLVFCVSAVQASNPESIQYFRGSYEELVQEAAARNMPYLLFFSYRGYEESQKFERSCLSQPFLSQYINQNFLAFRVEVNTQSRGGQFLEETFNVRVFPSVLIFDEQSQEKERLGGYRDAQDVLDALRHVEDRGQGALQEQPLNYMAQTSVRRIDNEFFGENEVVSTGNPSQYESTDQEVLIIDEAEAEYQESQNSYPNENDRQILDMKFDFEQNQGSRFKKRYIQEPVSQEEDLPVSSHRERQSSFQSSADDRPSYEPSQAGYRIQTGAFKERYFMRQELEFLRSNFPHDVFVQKIYHQGSPIYKVQVGPFKSKEDARQFRQEFLNKTHNRGTMLIYVAR